MRNVAAVAVGILVAFVLVLLIMFGILAPVLSWLFQIEPSPSAVRNFAPLAFFVCAVAFYFGGMAGAYKAPDRHLLHGTLVAPVAFVLCPRARSSCAHRRDGSWFLLTLLFSAREAGGRSLPFAENFLTRLDAEH